MELIAAWAFLLTGMFVLFAVFPGRSSHITFPSLLPVFGVPFALLFLAAQIAMVAWLKSRRGAVLIATVFIAGLGLAWCGHAMDLWGKLSEHNIGLGRYLLGGGACASGVALGAALLRGWVTDDR